MTPPHLPQQPTSGSDRVGGKSARSRRVADTLATYRARLNERQTLGRPSPAIGESLSLLKQAEDALGRDDLSGAWSLVLEAERTEIVAMSDEERQARAVALRCEAGDKLRGWRRKAVSELLGDGVHGRTPNADELREAMQVRNEHFHNLYHKLDLTREQLIFLGVVLLVLLIGLVALVEFGRRPLGDLRVHDLVPLMVVGALGGSLSAVRTLAGPRDRRIPDQLADWPITVLRPLIGAGAAAGVAFLLQASVVRFGDPNRQELALLAAAFVAGFSERWFLGLVGSIEEAV